MKKKILVLAIAGVVSLQAPMVALAYGTDTLVEENVAYVYSNGNVADKSNPDIQNLAQEYTIAEGGFVGFNTSGYTVVENKSVGPTKYIYCVDNTAQGVNANPGYGIQFNQEGAEVTTNTGGIYKNSGTVTFNNGVVFSNASGGTVGTNHGTVLKNRGLVELNKLDGVVTNGEGGVVQNNEGTVINAELNENGDLVYKQNGDTYYGITYADGKIGLSNESVKAGTTITIQKAETKADYTFVSWVFTSPDGKQTTYYYAGQEIDVENPLLLKALYEQIAAEKKASFTGTEGNSVSGGTWNCGPGGFWTYNNNGVFKNTWGNIRLSDGRTGWFYFDKDGIMQTGWKQIDGKWYYFNEAHDGAYGMMLTNTIAPDGRRVGADGVLIQ